MLVNSKEFLKEADIHNYAVGSFNAYNYETFKGIVEAGIETQTPVIVAFGAKYLKNMPLNTVYAITCSLARNTDLPVCLHLDHCSDMDVVFRAIRNGFTSVMYDGSALSFAENAANTRQVCAVAHACGVSVEAELGCLAAGERSHEGSADDVASYTEPAAAKNFVEETNADALAVSIGTVHGLYKGKPDLRIDILEKIHKLLATPLVLHGGSGLPEADISRCIANGIRKININTEVSVYTVDKTAELLAAEQPHFSELSLCQAGYVKDIVKKYIAFFAKCRDGAL